MSKLINIILHHQVFFNKPTNQPEAAMTSIQKQYTQDPYRSDSQYSISSNLYWDLSWAIYFYFIFGLDFFVSLAALPVIIITIIRIIIALAGSKTKLAIITHQICYL